MKIYVKLILAAVFLALCSLASAQSPSTVLVVGNANNANSVSLVNYYMTARNIPAQNQLLLNLPAQYTPDNADTCSVADYTNLIAAPIYAKIKTLPHIDYIVLCRNLPVKIQFNNPEPNPEYNDSSVDSCLAANSTSIRVNPYAFGSGTFSSTTYNMYLVTRLDGWSWSDAFALVDNSLKAKPGGLFLLDEEPDLNAKGYTSQNFMMARAATQLLTLKASVQLDATTLFCAPAQLLGGYISFGSTDDHFSAAAFNGLTFAPGAIAETFVNSSAINLRYPQPGMSNGGAYWNDSQISTLIHNGVTGIKGYVAGAYAYAFANPSYLFPGYMSGKNLAQSFYWSSQMLGWKDVVIGDPLCCPY
jgi:uncharacterized protein (TIGR03790 family)